MVNLETIAPAEQKSFIESFWTMLRECETKADNDDPILKQWVEAYYLQWNRVTNSTNVPIWKFRENETKRAQLAISRAAIARSRAPK